MRKLSLKGYCQNILKKTTTQNTMSIKKLVKECEESNIRLYVPLLTYCFLTDKNVDPSSRIYKELEAMKNQNLSKEEESVLNYLESTDEYENVRFVKSFRSENLRRNHTEMKSLGRQVILLYQTKYKLKIKEISKLGNCSSSNLSSFLKNNDLNRISLKNINLIIDNLENNYGKLS